MGKPLGSKGYFGVFEKGLIFKRPSPVPIDRDHFQLI